MNIFFKNNKIITWILFFSLLKSPAYAARYQRPGVRLRQAPIPNDRIAIVDAIKLHLMKGKHVRNHRCPLMWAIFDMLEKEQANWELVSQSALIDFFLETGVLFFPHEGFFLLINSKFRGFSDRCKSEINGTLAKMGARILQPSEVYSRLQRCAPYLVEFYKQQSRSIVGRTFLPPNNQGIRTGPVDGPTFAESSDPTSRGAEDQTDLNKFTPEFILPWDEDNE
ncbi:MAG: hypothetical protein NkDv07_0762 [Candidatus Improbicoccus devescovinae]|nr:MAG: hypothetical protein NkDv07_0762 [Candidatus Improbicoccus devescovinae]